MIKVYCAGDYSANNVITVLKNIGKGLRACSELFTLGFAPFCPWADRDFIIQNPDSEFIVKQFHDASMLWLEVSDCVYVISGKGNKGGVDKEIAKAQQLNIPIFYELSDLLDWRDNLIF